MIGLLDPRLWLAVALLAALAYFTGRHHGSEAADARSAFADTAAITQQEVATARVETKTVSLGKDHQAIDSTLLKENKDAKTTIDALRADVRSGALSLSIATRALRAGAGCDRPATGDSETRTELVPETAIDLVNIAADGDDAVRDLNACIAKYDAVRRTTNP